MSGLTEFAVDVGLAKEKVSMAHKGSQTTILSVRAHLSSRTEPDHPLGCPAGLLGLSLQPY